MIFSVLFSLFVFSETLSQTVGEVLSPEGYLLVASFSLGLEFILFLAGFLFRGFALYRMSRRARIGTPWFAFVPFLALTLAGRLQGNDGLFARFRPLGIAAAITSAVYVVAEGLIDVLYALPVLQKIFQGKYLVESDFGVAGYNLIQMIANFASLAAVVLVLLIHINLFKIYAPRKATSYAVISMIFDVLFSTALLFYIFLFTMRNNERCDYAQYVRSRMQPRYGQGGGNPYGGNPFNGPYGNGNGPYGNGGNSYGGPYGNGSANAYGNGNGEPKADPFEEFSDHGRRDDDPFADFGRRTPPDGGNGGEKQQNGDPYSGTGRDGNGNSASGGNASDDNDLFS